MLFKSQNSPLNPLLKDDVYSNPKTKKRRDSIKPTISNAVQELNFSVKEYAFTNEVLARCDKLKEKIQKKTKSQLRGFDRKILIEYGYEKGVDEFIKTVKYK